MAAAIVLLAFAIACMKRVRAEIVHRLHPISSLGANGASPQCSSGTSFVSRTKNNPTTKVISATTTGYQSP